MYTYIVYTFFCLLKRVKVAYLEVFLKEFIASQNDDGKRLSRFVYSVTQNLPNSLLYKSFRNGRIKVNGKKAVADTRLVRGDKIQLYINDEFFENGTTVEKNVEKASSGVNSRTNFTILWQNKDIAFLHKPSGLLCHEDKSDKATLLDSFTAYLIEKGDYVPSKENTFSPALCNRLDYGTEGIVIAAKNYIALRDMNELIAEDLLEKKYLCITVGKPPEGIHTAYLTRDKNEKTVKVTKKEIPGSKKIITGVEVFDSSNGLSLCKITLYTGRTHQIRAHLSFLQTPILGDVKYGNIRMNRKFSLQSQALCANEIQFSNSIPKRNHFHSLENKNYRIEKPKILNQWNGLCSE